MDVRQEVAAFDTRVAIVAEVEKDITCATSELASECEDRSLSVSQRLVQVNFKHLRLREQQESIGKSVELLYRTTKTAPSY